MPLTTFVARQPIFDRSIGVHGYELLFRRGIENVFDGSDPSAATESVVSSWIFSVGIDRLTGSHLGFINVPRKLLLDGFPTLLNPSVTVLEIPETVAADEEVVQACKDLKGLGFRLALDDYVLDPMLAPLVDVADIIKVDIQQVSEKERGLIEDSLAGSGTCMLAEKVETAAEFEAVLDAGYQLFQGYFFAEPEIIRGKPLAVPKHHYLELLQQVNRPEFSFHEVAEIIQRDASLSYKLLRYLNCAASGWRTQIQSIRHALVLLGQQETRRWVSLAALEGTLESRPQELLLSCVVRGRMCELLADPLGLSRRSMDFFFLGMLSRFDQVMDEPMEDVLTGIPLADDVRDALVHAEVGGVLAGALALVTSFEAGGWEEVERSVQRLGFDELLVPPLYLDALEWAEALFRSMH